MALFVRITGADALADGAHIFWEIVDTKHPEGNTVSSGASGKFIIPYPTQGALNQRLAAMRADLTARLDKLLADERPRYEVLEPILDTLVGKTYTTASGFQ